jgi:triacylglycerol lipase
LGFSELRLAGSLLPSIHYWHGIREALIAQGVEVITASVPASSSIEKRAAQLAAHIEEQASGRPVTVIAHSMGGLDARYMISHLRNEHRPDVRALVTVATPHRGSSLADAVLEGIGARVGLPRAYAAWKRATGLGTRGFEQLTRRYMIDEFNPNTPDDPAVRYFSYGAALITKPPLLSPFRMSHKLLEELEGPNDGLVGVESSRWGTYKGTLVGVSHLDLINWSNRLRWTMRKWMGQHRT